ncbi:MAG TPA: DNA repair protein RecO [Polyangiaceae bacterium]|nr:DNA repair protein RecO [Polyangiaceae bacterium]
MSRSFASTTHDSEALVLRRVEYGEADLILTLFTRSLGKVSAMARSARKSRRRFGGMLEPFFTLTVRLQERPGVEIMQLTEAALRTPRLGLLADLTRLEAAGRALGWVRAAAPPRTPEPEVWATIERLLDRLARSDNQRSPELELAEAGLSLLNGFGWGIDFERCVRCGKPCPEHQPAGVDPLQGGLVCRACGGARLRVASDQRVRLARAAAGDGNALDPSDGRLALDIVERSLEHHAGIGAG